MRPVCGTTRWVVERRKNGQRGQSLQPLPARYNAAMAPPAAKPGAPTGQRRSGSEPVPWPSTTPRWFWLVLAVFCLVGGVLRFLLRADYLANHPLATYLTADASVYWGWAGRIAAGQWRDEFPFFSAPLYPYLLGLLRALGGELPTLYTIQALLDIVTAGLLAYIARLRFGPSVGLLAAAVFLLMLEPASFCLRVLSSTLQLLLVCLAWLTLLVVQQRGVLPRGILAGAVLGLLALTTPPAVLCLLVFAVWWWWNDGRGVRGLWRAGVCLAAGAAFISPAAMCNYYTCGEFIPISAQAGVTFAQGNAPGATGIYTGIPGVSRTRHTQNLDALRVYREATGKAASWNGADRFFLRKGLVYWGENPLRTVRLLALKMYWFLTGRNYGDIYQPTMERAEGVLWRLHLTPLHTAWLIPPALVALVLWLRRANTYLPELMLFGVPLIVVLVFWFSPRYRLPAVPVVVVACAWVVRQAFWGRRWRRWSIAAGVSVVAGVGLGLLNGAVAFDRPDPYRALFRNGIAFALSEHGRPEDAARWYRKALEADPELAPAHADLGTILAQLGRTDEAVGHLRRAVDVDPENPLYRDQLARALVQQQRLDAAIQQFRAAVALDPDRVSLRNNLGNALLLNGNREAAIRQYEAALRTDPAYSEAHFNLGRALAAEGQVDRALGHLTEAARLTPNLIDAHMLSAHILLSQGHARRGIAALRKAYERAPENPALANDLAWYLATTPGLEKGDRTEALNLAEQAVAQAPERSAGRLDTLAAALAANGQFERAATTMQEALELAAQTRAQELMETFRQRLELYKSGRPYVEPSNRDPTATSPSGP